ncbi:MAG: PfkB family carbohydrate kinase [Chlamydiales bacterium]|nr:PfkB family carbohydrate kinase [Chlamydiales bacterium]
MHTKIKTFQEIQNILRDDKQNGFSVVQCHGVFDLLHPGHIRHLAEAKKQGDKLIVTLTPDRFVNKGPGRPAFNEQLRCETLAAIVAVDYVVLNETADAVSCIQKIKPDVYVKGVEYVDHAADVTGKISEEVSAVNSVGGKVHYTDDIVFSSSSLINRYIDPVAPVVTEFLEKIKKEYRIEDVIRAIDGLSTLKVLVVGDAIIDEYQYVSPLGQSGKGLHMAARCLEKEVFLGGSLIVANHVAGFAGQVDLITSVGRECPHLQFIHQALDPKVGKQFTYIDKATTLTKKRYVLKDGKTLSKLFETYSTNESLLTSEQTEEIVADLRVHAKEYDVVIACDFGNGFTNPKIVEALSLAPTFLAVNTQTNSGNRGFNVVTHYKRADFISLNEPELRLAAHDRHNPLEDVVEKVAHKLNCPSVAITRGVEGVECYARETSSFTIPALTTNVIDRIGAGDSFLAIASLGLAKGYSFPLSGFLGSVAAAMDVQIVGNRESVQKAPFCKYVTRLLK